MNRFHCKSTVRLAGAAALFVASAVANAQAVDFVVDGLANCFDLSPGGSGGNAAAQYVLSAGTYTVKVKSSTTAFCSGGRCLQPAVALNLWGGNSYYEPFLLKPGVKGMTKQTLAVANGGTLYAQVMDGACGDNSGSTTLSITKTQ
jgi:hypothetical protein